MIIKQVYMSETELSCDMYFELCKLFPSCESYPVYPYSILVDGNSYTKEEYAKIQTRIDNSESFIGWCKYIKYDFETSLVEAISNDDALLITKEQFDVSKFPKKYHDSLQYMKQRVMNISNLFKVLDENRYDDI